MDRIGGFLHGRSGSGPLKDGRLHQQLESRIAHGPIGVQATFPNTPTLARATLSLLANPEQ